MLSLIFIALLGCHQFLLSLELSATAKRRDFVEAISSEEGDKGSWGEIQYCDNGTFAVGFLLKVQPNRWFSDDTAVNSFGLLCAEFGSGANSLIYPPNNGEWGEWQANVTCPDGSHIIGFKSKVDPSESSESDHTALNAIQAKCNDESSTIIEAGGGQWGAWAPNFAECTDNSVVCGFKIKVQSDQGRNDNTAMNALELECCSNQTCSDTCSYELVQANHRNIIFVGRSRAGKSTLIEVLKDKQHNPDKMTIFQGTKQAALSSFSMRSEECDQNLNLNIMDTPGLFESTREENDHRTNEVILDIITKCIDMEITKINHVYFVMSLLNGLNTHDVESFGLFTKLFVGMEDKISIILSFTQDVATQEDRQHYITQFQDHKELKSMYRTAQKRIFFLGAAQVNTFSHREELRQNVYKQRNELFEHIVAQDGAFTVKELKIYKDTFNNTDL